MLRAKLLSGLMILALFAAFGCDREVIIQGSNSAETSCFVCHTDQEFFLVAAQQQWANSIHASGNNIDRNRNNQSFYSACEKCHTNEGFLAREEVTGIPAVGDHFTVIACFTCHAPHTNGNFDLRITDPIVLADGATFDKGPANLCASCHQSRQNVNTYVVDSVTMNSRFGPHNAPQSDMLAGTNAYEYSGFIYRNSAHTNVATEGCINCHKTGSQANLVGGHTFNMEDTSRGFQNTIGCNVTSCHDGGITDLHRLADADFDFDGTIENVHDEIEGLMDSLQVLLELAGLVNASGTPLSMMVADADSAGAVFNFKFVEKDSSHGVHNTDYAVGLLVSAINYLNTGNPNGAPTVVNYSGTRY